MLEYARQLNAALNQSLVNWYECDGSIGRHSDDTRQLKDHSDVFSFSFGPAKRTFILEPKKPKKPKKKGSDNDDNDDNAMTKYHIRLEHNTLVVMGGQCQQTHAHSVPKVNAGDKLSGRRLNITFRCFK